MPRAHLELTLLRHTHFLIASGLAFLSLVAFAPRANAGDPRLSWSTIHTEHFTIHHHSGQSDLPQRVALYCEQAHEILAPLTNWEPAEPVLVVLDDRLDTANGSAGIIPRNIIRLYGYAPTARSNLGDYDDWLLSLIIHEYAHILHIDNVSGLPALLNRVVGKTAAPNQLLPRWYTEGYATYQESARTGGGRVRSSLFHMFLRAAWKDDDLLDLGGLSGNIQSWPRGSNWYLYGSHFLAYIAETRGEEFFTKFHTIYGSRVFPYSMNTTLHQVLGQTFVELYEEWIAHLSARMLAENMVLRIQGVTPFEKITDEGEIHNTPRHRPGTRQVSFYASNGREHEGLYLHDLKTGKVERETRLDGGGSPHSWSPEGRYLAVHTSTFFRNTYASNDLFLHDLKTGRDKALTEGARARDPEFSPDGETLYYVKIEEARSNLYAYHLREDRHEKLYTPPLLSVIDTPRSSPDGRFVAFSAWLGEGNRDLFLYDTKTQNLLRVTRDQALDMDPSFSPDGKHLLFSSDRTLLFDIYALNLEQLTNKADALSPQRGDPQDLALPVTRLTRTDVGFFTPEVVQIGDESWLYVSYYNTKGYDLGRLPFAPDKPAGETPAAQHVRPRVTYPVIEKPIQSISDYKPWLYMAPPALDILTAFSSSGRGSYGLEASGSDPVGHHFWSFVGEYFEETENTLFLANYSYNRLPISVGLGLQHSVYERGRSFFAESRYIPFEEEAWDAQLSLGFPISNRARSHILSLSYNLRLTDFFEGGPPTYSQDPADLSVREPRQGNFSSVVLRYGVTSSDGFSLTVGTQEGYSIRGSLRLRDTATGADVRSVQATYQASVADQVPFVSRHSVRLSLQGGFGRSNYRGREQFALGGIPRQETTTALINMLPLGGSFLRGYEPGSFAGEQYHLVSLEYRAPLYDLEMGFDTVPFRLGRLAVVPFADVGAAFNGPLEEADWYPGTGLELRMTSTLAYALPANFRLGYARGYGSQGISDFYFYYGGGF